MEVVAHLRFAEAREVRAHHGAHRTDGVGEGGARLGLAADEVTHADALEKELADLGSHCPAPGCRRLAWSSG